MPTFVPLKAAEVVFFVSLLLVQMPLYIIDKLVC